MRKNGISLLSLIIGCIVIVAIIIIAINIIKNHNNVKGENNTKNNVVAEKTKFSVNTLEINGLGINSTIEQLKTKFENLIQKNSYVDGTTGDNIDEYSNENVQLTFKNNQLVKSIVTGGNFEFNGIKIGDSSSKVIDSFYKDNTNADVIDNKDGNIGKYLYGNYTVNNLYEVQMTGSIQYAYVGNEKTKIENLYDYCIMYVYMQPPYINQYASKEDKASCLQFGIKDDKVVVFATQYASLKD